MIRFEDILDMVQARGVLSETDAEQAFSHILSGTVGETEIIAFLNAVRERGPSVGELVGGARVLRRHATPVPRPAGGPFAGAQVVDTCGTGGAPKLFNVSTLATIVVPAAAPGQVMVAKHGNVSRTGRGSAEVMKHLGVKVDAAPAVQSRCLGEVGVCFCLAPAHHPAARHAAAARKAIGKPTIFNLLGPLSNPAGAEHQVIGTWTHENARLMAEALARLGTSRAWVYCSRDGLDELTLSARSLVEDVASTGVRTLEIDPLEYGLAPARIGDMQVESLEAAAEVFGRVLGGERGAFRDMTLLSTAAALVVGGAAENLEQGLAAGREAIDSGRAAKTLQRLIATSNGA